MTVARQSSDGRASLLILCKGTTNFWRKKIRSPDGLRNY